MRLRGTGMGVAAVPAALAKRSTSTPFSPMAKESTNPSVGRPGSKRDAAWQDRKTTRTMTRPGNRGPDFCARPERDAPAVGRALLALAPARPILGACSRLVMGKLG